MCCGSTITKKIVAGVVGIAKAAAGVDTVPMVIAVQRRARCAACKHGGPAAVLCGLCGCFIKVKTAIGSEACPDDPPQWPAHKG